MILLSGCGEKVPTGFPKLVPCTVTVSDGGKPVADCFVVLHNETAAGFSTAAVTDENGRAELKTSGGNFTKTGVPLGKAV
ncbi:MAG: hypothetical protein LBH00_04355, partial [Planctomycetaceae bacterium]|nr:hypothetical protein [Planctomycetaceae bacterium]